MPNRLAYFCLSSGDGSDRPTMVQSPLRLTAPFRKPDAWPCTRPAIAIRSGLAAAGDVNAAVVRVRAVRRVIVAFQFIYEKAGFPPLRWKRKPACAHSLRGSS